MSFNESVQIKFFNALSGGARSSLTTILHQLAELCPSDSLFTADIHQEGEAYNADIQVHSQQLHITAHESGDSVYSLIGALTHDITEKIDAWKKIRNIGTEAEGL
ncbi:MAG: hypothetical protein COT73_06405 [Bdellovibrio sp. CG10_big_fil_rev_8_21_14_0_10_47_8]|nr:MAG: hypothetical protein COT73_06405 [Bdellovibrio sp. CG10_big_fil_rev_8_21_14_0_10_47_8]